LKSLYLSQVKWEAHIQKVWRCLLFGSVEGVFEPLAKVWLVSQKSKEIQSSHNSFGEKHDCMNLGWLEPRPLYEI